jgi:hypothetical protein
MKHGAGEKQQVSRYHGISLKLSRGMQTTEPSGFMIHPQGTTVPLEVITSTGDNQMQGPDDHFPAALERL